MRISVAVCVYNGERFLQAQLDSIASQTRPVDEVVVLDDRSTDASASIVEAFAARVPFPVRFQVNPTNLGVTQNFETAIRQAQGDLIFTADQDDVWLPRKVQVLADLFESEPDLGLAFSDAQVVDEQGSVVSPSLWETVRFSRGNQQRFASDAFRVLLRRPVVTGATMAFRADLRELFLPIAPGWLHDEWFALLAAGGSMIRAVPERLMLYRKHANNQVGILGSTVGERARASLARPSDFLSQRSSDFRRLAEVMEKRLPSQPELASEVLAKARHFEVRGGLASSRWARLAPVVAEVLSGRYGRYSGHWATPIRDLLVRG